MTGAHHLRLAGAARQTSDPRYADLVEMILELIAKGATQAEILEDFPQLEPEDLQAALLYAHHLVAGETLIARLAA